MKRPAQRTGFFAREFRVLFPAARYGLRSFHRTGFEAGLQKQRAATSATPNLTGQVSTSPFTARDRTRRACRERSTDGNAAPWPPPSPPRGPSHAWQPPPRHTRNRSADSGSPRASATTSLPERASPGRSTERTRAPAARRAPTGVPVQWPSPARGGKGCTVSQPES